MNIKKIYLLRVIHGLFALYFISCLIYLYFGALSLQLDIFLLIALVSLGIEGLLVFIFNDGDCPLIHIQRKIGDEVPFFELFFPSKMAKKAIPFFAFLTWLGVGLLIVRLILERLF